MDAEDNKSTSPEAGEANLYEVAYILDPMIPEEKLQEHAAKITSAIEEKGGMIVLADNPKLRALAYQIEKAVGGKRAKYKQGYFAWVKCMLTPKSAKALEGELKHVQEVVRSMIIHTVKASSTYVARKPRREGAVSGVGPLAPVEKPTEAELDKEVDTLLASTGVAV